MDIGGKKRAQGQKRNGTEDSTQASAITIIFFFKKYQTNTESTILRFDAVGTLKLIIKAFKKML